MALTKLTAEEEHRALHPLVNKIDVDRGVWIKSDPGTGIQVIMYVDEPGVFLSWHGRPVADELAASAGFDVKQLKNEKLKRERMAAAGKLIEAEFAAALSGSQVVVERGGFKLMDLGGGRFTIRDEDNNPMSRTVLTEEQARKVFDQLAPVEENAPTPAAIKVKPSGAATNAPTA